MRRAAESIGQRRGTSATGQLDVYLDNSLKASHSVSFHHNTARGHVCFTVRAGLFGI